MRGSGDAWTTCGDGHKHWGLFGGAGLLLRDRPSLDADVLLQLRAGWSHHGGTWGTPGGARDGHETAVETALREAGEEIGLDPTAVRPEALFVDDHGGWTYTTVLATQRRPVTVDHHNAETDDVRWISPAALDGLPIHPGFGRTWAVVGRVPLAPRLVVDAANVIGSRPDGWWKDRAGAVRGLRDRLAALGSDGLDLGSGPVFPEIVLVTEGVTRGVEAVAEVDVVSAPGSGDDTIVAVAARPSLRSTVVVTADRELRARVEALGATTVGPRTLLDQLG